MDENTDLWDSDDVNTRYVGQLSGDFPRGLDDLSSHLHVAAPPETKQ